MIRSVRPEDAKQILDIYAPIIENSHWSFELEVPSEKAFRERINNISSAFPYLIIEQEGRVVGYAYATRLRERAAYIPSVETSIYLHPDVHGKGLGRSLYGTLIKVLELAGYSQFYAGASLPNAVSAAFHERVGFKPVGIWPKVGYKFGQWWDVGWWHRERIDPITDPMIVMPIEELRSDPRLIELLSTNG